MRKKLKLFAVLSTASLMTAVTPTLTLTVPGMVQTAFAAANSGWVEEDGALRYKDSDGYYLTDSWKKKDGFWYYLDEEGYISRSTMVDEYYVDADGKRISNQWVSVANEDDWDDEAPETYWFYYGKNGKCTTSKWLSIEEKMYYFLDDGHMATGKLELDGSTYYLGDENDGVMKTGWVQLPNEDEDAEEEFVWHYFDYKGKMVVNQIDRKIGDAYYTFENGILKTGWYKLPEITEETATASDATVSETLPAIASYQYYEEDGKHGNGWYQLEGDPEFAEEGEVSTYYLKNGAPYYARTGVQVFTIDGKRFGFNTKGELQTGLQTVTYDDGETAMYYFGDDGVMRTGKQSIYNEDLGETQTWFFLTDGAYKGSGFHGVRDNCVYQNGLRLDADRDLRYAPVSLDGVSYLVNASGSIQKAGSSSTSASRPELGKGFRDVKDSNDKIWVVDTNGIVQ